MKRKIFTIATIATTLSLVGCSHNLTHPTCCAESKNYEEKHFPSNCCVEPKLAQHASCCAQQNFHQLKDNTQKQQQKVYEVPKSVVEPKLIKITGVGYGAESTYEGYTDGQRRLMAIRSAKLDAYRSLAEQLNGIKIDSNTTVSTLTARNDNFRARVNSMVRGARVISVTPMADQNYETVLEVYVDRGFFEKAFVYSDNEDKVSMTTQELCDQINCEALGSANR